MTKKTKIKNCKKHGHTKYTLRSDGYYRCAKCNSEAASKSRRNQKRKLVEYFGGRCIECGYDRYDCCMDFHHIDPSTKSFGISDGRNRAWEKVLAEAKKCVLLCTRCHQEIECDRREGIVRDYGNTGKGCRY